MYLFYMVYGISVLLISYTKLLPDNTDYFTLTLAYFGTDLLLYFHLHGRSHLDVHLHTLLVIAFSLATVSCIIELAFQKSPLAALLRPFFTIVMGSWFIQVGYILYNPFSSELVWQEHDHAQLMFATSIFCWHLLSTCILFGLLCRYFKTYTNSYPYALLSGADDG